MDPVKQANELLLVVNRAKRAGLKVHHYPDEHLAVIRMIPPAVVATDTPPAPVLGAVPSAQ